MYKSNFNKNNFFSKYEKAYVEYKTSDEEIYRMFLDDIETCPIVAVDTTSNGTYPYSCYLLTKAGMIFFSYITAAGTTTYYYSLGQFRKCDDVKYITYFAYGRPITTWTRDYYELPNGRDGGWYAYEDYPGWIDHGDSPDQNQRQRMFIGFYRTGLEKNPKNQHITGYVEVNTSKNEKSSLFDEFVSLGPNKLFPKLPKYTAGFQDGHMFYIPNGLMIDTYLTEALSQLIGNNNWLFLRRIKTSWYETYSKIFIKFVTRGDDGSIFTASSADHKVYPYPRKYSGAFGSYAVYGDSDIVQDLDRAMMKADFSFFSGDQEKKNRWWSVQPIWETSPKRIYLTDLGLKTSQISLTPPWLKSDINKSMEMLEKYPDFSKQYEQEMNG